MKKTKQTKAERIADLIGYDVFLRAEAYYYENDSYYVNGCHVGINFADRLEKLGADAIHRYFIWSETLEGHKFWYDIYLLIRKWENNS